MAEQVLGLHLMWPAEWGQDPQLNLDQLQQIVAELHTTIEQAVGHPVHVSVSYTEQSWVTEDEDSPSLVRNLFGRDEQVGGHGG